VAYKADTKYSVQVFRLVKVVFLSVLGDLCKFMAHCRLSWVRSKFWFSVLYKLRCRRRCLRQLFRQTPKICKL